MILATFTEIFVPVAVLIFLVIFFGFLANM